MSNNKGLINNLIWKFAERITAQLVTLVISVILARLLDPSHYGIIAIVTIFISIANVFVSDGLGSALIQKKDADSLDFSSVLYFNIGISIILYFILYLFAPVIANFFGEGYELISPVLRVLGVRLIFSAINSVQQSYIAKQMIFKKFFLATLLGTVVSAFVGISMAYQGFGVWALVGQYMTNTTVDTIVLAISLKKKPLLNFSFDRVRNLLGFGSRVLMTALVVQGYQELRALIIGKLYSTQDLAFYDKGKQFPNLLVVNINASISAVLFPKLSSEQNNSAKIKAITRQSIRFGTYVLSPILLGLAAVADTFVVVVLTEKWLPCVHLMQMMCVFYLFQPIQTANTQAMKAVGQSKTILHLEIIRDVIQLIVLAVVMWISVDAIVASMAILSFFYVFVNAYPNKKIIDYSIKEQLGDLFPGLAISLVMAVSVLLIGHFTLQLPALVRLIVQVVSGGLIFILISHVTHNAEYAYIIKSIRKIVKRG